MAPCSPCTEHPQPSYFLAAISQKPPPTQKTPKLPLSNAQSLAVPYWSDIYGRAERDYEKWRKSTMTARYKHETRFLYGRKAPIPPNCDAIEALLRLELLTQFPNWLSQQATMLGCTSSHDILKMALKEIFPMRMQHALIWWRNCIVYPRNRLRLCIHLQHGWKIG